MVTARSEADWRAAIPIAPLRFDVAALECWFARIDPIPFIRRGLPMLPAPVWSREALSALFGLDNPNHCFYVAPHRWTTFHEPQITKGFEHFLNQGGRDQRLARAKAFVRAAAACAGKDMQVEGATSACCRAEQNRTDLLVELVVDGKLVGASIEAKFGHVLTKGQLPKALRTIRGDRERFALLVVAPDDPSGTFFVRRNRRKGWRGTSWWTLLARLEELTDAEHDDDDYRRFRRTVWGRAY